MKRYLILLTVISILYETAEGQVYRYRISTNSGMFLSEIISEVDPPVKLSHPGSRDFKSELKPGIELEIIRPVTRDFETGLQLGYLNLAGQTPTAPLYNFFL